MEHQIPMDSAVRPTSNKIKATKTFRTSSSALTEVGILILMYTCALHRLCTSFGFT
jgi:hypothetical protein